MASSRSLAFSLAVVLLGSGCALAVSGPSPDRPRNEVPQCDTGKGLVAADGLWGTLFGVSSLAAFSNEETGVGVALGGITALFIASAMRGNNAANDCRNAFNEYNVAIRDEQQRLLADRQPAVKVRPKKPKPVAPPVEPPPPQAEPVEQTPEPAPEPAPEYTSPRPPQIKPVAKPEKPEPAKPAPKPRSKPQPPTDDDWSSFWKEVP